jgi:hypothetical protein
MVEPVSGQVDPRKQRVPSARVQDLRHAHQGCRRHQEMNLLRVVFILCFALVFYLERPAFGGKIYKWVDERGVVHFSDREPELDKLKGKVEEREISPGGYALTCKHVVEDVPNLTALLNDQQEAQLNVISLSSKYDLALVQIMLPKKMPFLSIRDAESLAPGDRLFAVGASAGLQSTVTDGVFTGFRNIESVSGNFIQFSAPLNPGNSGGPLVDVNGMVVGVVSLKFLSQQGMPVSGVGFAVPSAHVKEEYSTYIEK